MSPIVVTKVARSVVTVSGVALLALLSSNVANTQGISATANAAQSNTAADVKTLRQQVGTLETRVAELEKEKLELAKDDSDDEARMKKLEQRLATLEKRPETGKPANAGKQDRPDDDESLTVRAPFVVLDEGGRTIFRVDIAPGQDRARIMVGNPIGVRAEIGPDGIGGAAVALYDSANSPRAYLSAQKGESHLLLAGAKLAVQLDADSIGGNLTLFNSTGLGNARLTIGKGGAGSFTLGNAGGATVVQAGTNGNGVGVVQAGPRMGGAIGGLVVPDALMGKK